MKGGRPGTWVPRRGHGFLWIDGGCRPTNPGPAALACVVKLDGEIFELARPVGIKTNNQAEYMALLVGIKYAYYLGATGLGVYTDSKLIVHQMKDQWYVREPTLRQYRHDCRAVLDGYFDKNWELEWISRKQNTHADALCTEAIKSNNPWVPNFKDPFHPPAKKWRPYARGIRFDGALGLPRRLSSEAP